MTDARDSAPNGGPDSIGLSSILRSDDTVLSPVQPGPAQLPALGLPGYEFIREIHRGGQGVVYLALQRSTHRRVAIKIMKEGPFAGPEDRSRFDREVRILAHLKHPSIVAIHDSGSAAGCDYFVMDFVEGQPLDDYLKSHPLSIPDLVELFRRICEAVQSAHELGVVHRDLKPGNIRIDTSGVPYILDFGLAKMPGSAFEASQMTQTGLFIGSLPWASPEQAEGHVSRIDSRTDVYSLGVIFYTALAGHPPYSVSGSVSDAIHQIVNAAPARPSIFHREIESDLETIVLKCLQKEPHRRYANAGEIAYDLAAYQSGQPISAKRDSTSYVVKKRAQLWLRSNPLPAYVVATIVAAALAHLVARPLIFETTTADRNFRRLAVQLASPRSTPSNLNDVRVIAFRPESEQELQAIARKAGVSGVSFSDPKSARRLHGRLMERLAIANPKTVVWDLHFPDPTKFDADFVRGVRALHSAGIDVTVGVKNWKLGESGAPPLSPEILPQVRWGSLSADFGDAGPWAVELLLYPRGAEMRGSLVLQAAAAFWQPGKRVSFDIEVDGRTVMLNYWEAPSATTELKRWLRASNTVELTAMRSRYSSRPREDIDSADLIGYYAITLPPDAALQASTIEYGDVFSASHEQLRDWFAGRAVMIGNFREKVDTFPYPDGTHRHGCTGQAVALNSLLSQPSIRTPSNPVTRTLTIAAAVIGTGIGAMCGRVRGRRFVVAALLASTFIVFAGLALGASLTLLRTSRYLCDPLVPLVAGVIALVLGAAIQRTRIVARNV